MTVNPLIAALRAGLGADVPGRVVHYPGFGASELAPSAAVPCASERTAVARAWGRSLVGLRSVVAIKGVGLGDAADAVVHVAAAGVAAGVALVVMDDPELEASQSVFDTRWLQALMPGLWLEPRTPQAALDLGALALPLSEACGLPVVIRVTGPARAAAVGQPVPRAPGAWVQRLAWRVGPAPELAPPLVHPSQALAHWRSLEQRRRIASRLANELQDAVPDARAAPCAVGERSALDAPPDARHAGNVRVVDGYEAILAPVRASGRFVASDLGTFTLDTAGTADACLCFGMAIAVAAGVAECGRPAVALVGDAALLHSGIVALLEADWRGDNVCVLVLDNAGSQSTGGECTGSLSGLARWVADARVVGLTDPEAPLVVARALAQPGPTVVHVEI